MPKSFILIVLLCGLIGVGCRPVQGSDDFLLPTLAPTALPESYELDRAEDVARRFLDAWRVEDYETMHSLITFATRDATPLSEFTALYEDVRDDMTLLNFDYQGVTLVRDQPAVATFHYGASFETLVVGTFEDASRNMQLVVDANDADWRVAWSPGDIFDALRDGGVLRLERVIPRRANIYDRNGLVLADQNGRMVSVNVIPGDIPAYEACVARLATALNTEITDITERLAASGAEWFTEIGVVEPTVYLEHEAVLARDCDATFEQRPSRRYPNGALMPHIVGYVGYPDEAQIPTVRAAGFSQDSILGKSGIEASWDETLRGTPGGRLSVVQGNEVTRIIAENPPVPAQSVWLTVDSGLQTYTQQRIAQAYADAESSWAPRSKGAAAVVLDVNTGAVLAMVSFPTYDANAFVPFPSIGRAAADTTVAAVQRNPRTPQLNRVTQGNYPSGSTMKIATALAVVDSGVYASDQAYTCIGSWARENGFVRADWLPQGHGLVRVNTAVAQSCNPYFYEVGYQMDLVDTALLPEYFNRFGLGVPSGLTDLPENPGLIAGPEFVRTTYGLNWTFSRAVNMAIGQDIDITPLQIARLTALVANGGDMYRPQLVLEAGLFGEPPSHTLEAELLDQIDIKPEALEVVREGMCAATNERYGTAEFQFRNQRIQQVRVCGKTGTAQAPGDGVDPHAWFTAYGPLEDPEIVVTVMVENSGEGSAVAAPIARDIMDYYFFEMGENVNVR